MVTIFHTIARKKYLIVFALIFLATEIYCLVSLQWLLGFVLGLIIAFFAFAFYYFDTRRQETENQTEWLMIASGVTVAAMAMAMAPWLVWAVTIAVLFLLLHVTVRIEKRLSMLEFQITRRVLRRRTRGRSVERHRA